MTRSFCAVLFSILLLSVTVTPSPNSIAQKESNGEDLISMKWTPRSQRLFIRDTSMARLEISYSGPPFLANLTYECGDGIECSVTKIEDIRLNHTEDIEIELTFDVNITDPVPYSSRSIVAVLENSSYETRKTATLNLNLFHHISAEILSPTPMETNSSFLIGNDLDLWNSYGLEGVGTKPYPLSSNRPLDIIFKISNLDGRYQANGYLGLNVKYRYENQDRFMDEELIRSDEKLILDPQSSTQVEFTLSTERTLDGKTLERIRVDLVFSSREDFMAWGVLYFISHEGPEILGSMRVSLEYEPCSAYSLRVLHYSDATGISPENFHFQGDYWEGVSFVIQFENLAARRMEDVVVVARNRIGPSSSFYYGSFEERTEISLGDVLAFSRVQKEILITPDISGLHEFTFYLKEKPEERALIFAPAFAESEIKLFLKSNLSLSYQNEIRCPYTVDDGDNCLKVRKYQMGENFKVRMSIDNSLNMTGRLSLSIFVSDNIGYVTDHHREVIDDFEGVTGGDLYSHTDFVELHPEYIKLRPGNSSYEIEVSGLFKGYLFLIPYIESGGKVLLFDENPEDQYFERDISRRLPMGYHENRIRKVVEIESSSDPMLLTILPDTILMILVIGVIIGYRHRRSTERPSDDGNGDRPVE